MSTKKNKAAIRCMIEEGNKGNLAVVNEIIADNYVYHSNMGEYKGPEGLKQGFTMLRSAFPDMHSTIEDMVAEGDKVAWRSTTSGTHKGDFMGIAPTGKKLTWQGSAIARFAGGKEVEAWGMMDILAIYQQLGITPPMGPGGR
jgi:predicted ester cyclase